MVTARVSEEAQVTMRRWFFAGIGFAFGIAVLAACATPPAHSPGREGLFDRWAKLRQLPRDGRTAAKVSVVDLDGSVRDCKPVTAPMSAVSDHSRTGASTAAVVPSRFRQIPMRWPLQSVVITSPFGQRTRDFHEGVDLKADKGTPVYSAHAGVVLYAGDHIRGYGNMVVIRHSSGMSTVYAHNSRLLVKKGQYVREGTRIALTGNTGHSTGPHLHFEVRNGITAVDPALLLPRARSMASTR